MYIDGRTIDLFSPFDREVGNPNRQRIRTQEQFEKFVYLNNGVSVDVFTSVYPCNPWSHKENHVIDKLFFDFDCNPKKHPDVTMQGVFDDFCHFYEFLVDIGEQPIPVITGKKGYHLYIPLKPIRATKLDLWVATLSVLYESDLIRFQTDKSGRRLWESSLAVDPTTIGDVEQLCRIPNTLRAPDNVFWCTWLPLERHDIRDMSVEDTFNWARRYHLRDDKCVRMRTVHDFATQELSFFEDFKAKHAGSVFVGSLDELDDKEQMLFSMLSPYIPESVIIRVIHPEADHDSRVVTALAMLESGLSADFVVSLLQLIGWNDWNIGTCRYQVEQIDRNRGTRYRYKGNYGARLLVSPKSQPTSGEHHHRKSNLPGTEQEDDPTN